MLFHAISLSPQGLFVGSTCTLLDLFELCGFRSRISPLLLSTLVQQYRGFIGFNQMWMEN